MTLWTKLKDLVEGVDSGASRAANFREEELRLQLYEEMEQFISEEERRSTDATTRRCQESSVCFCRWDAPRRPRRSIQRRCGLGGGGSSSKTFPKFASVAGAGSFA